MKRLGIILVAVVLLLAVAMPGFRKVLLFGAVVIVGLVLLVVLNESTTKQTPSVIYQPGSAVPPPPPKPIPPTSIEVRDMRTDFPGYNHQVSRVTVRLFNNSTTETLKKLDFRLLIADCKNAANKDAKRSGDCITVDDETGSFDYLNVPPREARDVSLTVKNLGVTILGSPRIDLTVTAAQADSLR